MLVVVRRLFGLALVALVLGGPLSACSSATKTAAVSGLDDSISSLAAGGVAVVDEVTAQAPVVAVTGTPSAMRFTRWQVQNLVAEANAHSGYLPSELDALATPPEGSPNLSVLIGAWLTRKDDPLAQYAATFMAGQSDKKTGIAVFPTLIVLSFIADIARATATTSLAPAPRFDFERLIAAPAEAQSVPGCSDVSNFVSAVIANVTSAIQANGSGWLATFWNTVVSVASTAVSVVTSILTPLVGFITKIATIVATIMQVTSMFKPWSVSLAGNPSSITLASTAQSGAFDATLQAQDVPWPAPLAGCVKALAPNAQLDDASYKNAPVTWTQPVNIPGLATNVASDTTLRANKTAHYTFTTKTVENVDPNDCPRLLDAGSVGITVTVERSDITKTLATLESLIAGQLPAALRGYLQPYIDTANEAVTTAAENFAAPHQSSVVMLRQQVADPLCIHTPPPGAPTPASTPTTAAGSASVPFLPCHQMLQEADITPFMNGAYLVDGDGADKIAKIMGALFSGTLSGVGGPGGPVVHRSDFYDNASASACLLGTGTITEAQMNDPTTPSNAKVAGFFVTIPHGTLAFIEPKPLTASDATGNDCVTAIGVDTLNRLKARCIDETVAVMIQMPNVEILIAAGQLPPNANASANAFTVPPGAQYKVLAHLLKRYAP